jgi:hypothetical protein
MATASRSGAVEVACQQIDEAVAQKAGRVAAMNGKTASIGSAATVAPARTSVPLHHPHARDYAPQREGADAAE